MKREGNNDRENKAMRWLYTMNDFGPSHCLKHLQEPLFRDRVSRD